MTAARHAATARRAAPPQPDPDPDQRFWRDPALPFAESRRACRSRACYRPHAHPTYSIGAVDAGASVFSGAADGPVRLLPGTLVFVPAARLHACNPARGGDWSYQMLHLDAGWLRAVRREYLGEAGEAGETIEPVRIVRDAALHARFSALNALLFSDAAAGDKEAALIEFVGDRDRETVDGALSIGAPEASPALAERLQPALACLRDAPAGALPLATLAALAGMSRYALIRAFRAVTGMTPHAWQLNARVNLARERLRAGDALAAIAHDLGFADQAHFQRVFKAHAGVTPGRFRG